MQTSLESRVLQLEDDRKNDSKLLYSSFAFALIEFLVILILIVIVFCMHHKSSSKQRILPVIPVTSQTNELSGRLPHHPSNPLVGRRVISTESPLNRGRDGSQEQKLSSVLNAWLRTQRQIR